MCARSFKPEFLADLVGRPLTWAGNGARFATRGEAINYSLHLFDACPKIHQTRVTESNDPVTHAWQGGAAVRVTQDDA